jgi:hypothetical protein
MAAGVAQSIREQVAEIGVDRREFGAAHHRIEKLFAHPHQRHRAERGEVQPAKQLLPPRLGRLVHVVCGDVGGRALPRLDRRCDPVAVGPEARQQHLEESDAGAGLQLRIAAEDFARQGDA